MNESQAKIVLTFDSDELLEKLSGNKDIYQRLVTKFLADANLLIKEIANLYAKQDWDSCRNEVHGLKGMAATVCAKRMQSHCKEFENAIDNHDYENVPGYISLLRSELLAFKEIL